jgi:hypothetical protein
MMGQMRKLEDVVECQEKRLMGQEPIEVVERWEILPTAVIGV